MSFNEFLLVYIDFVYNYFTNFNYILNILLTHLSGTAGE